MLVYYYLFTILLLASHYINCETMDNELIGDPEVNCEDTMMSINFKTKKPFNGRVYVKGMANDDRCSRNFAQNTEQNKFSFMIQSGDCTMQKQRVTGTLEGMMVSLTVVVSFHGTFVTKADRAFKAMCFFKNIRRITNAIDMNNLGTTELLDTAKMPTCTYHIRKTLDGPTVATGEVGDKIYHVWECDDPTHGFLVHSCFVDDGKGQRFDLLDIDGCAIDPIIQPDITYDEAHNRAVAETFGYKFADTSVLNYQCVVELCKRASGECEGLTPPDCTKRVKRNTHLSMLKNDNSTFELDLSATISVDDDTLVIENSDEEVQMRGIKKTKSLAKTFENGECNMPIIVSIAGTLLLGIIVNTATIVYFCSLKKIIPFVKA